MRTVNKALNLRAKADDPSVEWNGVLADVAETANIVAAILPDVADMRYLAIQPILPRMPPSAKP